jgi:glyceraldehyde 3-phosphate dehydrogenase
VVDGLATIAEEKNAVIYVWYDNEFGYSNQVVRVAAAMSGLERATLPAR